MNFWKKKNDKVEELHNEVFNRSRITEMTAQEILTEMKKGKNKIIDVMIENTAQREGTAFIYNVINADNGRFLGTIKADGFLHIAESLKEKSLKDGILYRFKGTIFINCNEYKNRTIKEKCK